MDPNNQPANQPPATPGQYPSSGGVGPQPDDQLPAAPNYDSANPGQVGSPAGSPAAPASPGGQFINPSAGYGSAPTPIPQAFPAAQPGVMPGAVPGTVPGMPGQPHAVPAHSNPNSTQNTLQIAEIRDGIVIMNDGSFRSVLMVKSINFDLMSPQEREAVEFSYQGFLNSLYFPVQIYIRSQKVDLGPYIQKLDKIRSEHDNMLLAYLMEDYILYMSDIAQQTNIMDKKFYVVIPFIPAQEGQKKSSISGSGKGFMSTLTGIFSSQETHVVINEGELEAAKTELRNRVQAALSGLQQCGIQGLPLDTQELIELYYDAYNPDTATRQQLKNFNDLNTPVVTKGQGMAPQPNLDKELR